MAISVHSPHLPGITGSGLKKLEHEIRSAETTKSGTKSASHQWSINGYNELHMFTITSFPKQNILWQCWINSGIVLGYTMVQPISMVQDDFLRG